MFTGDTLFLGGCGRFFEGSAEQMTEALVTTLGQLPGETKVSTRMRRSDVNAAFRFEPWLEFVSLKKADFLLRFLMSKNRQCSGRLKDPMQCVTYA